MTSYALPARRAVRRQPSVDEPSSGHFPANHQAPLCWGCFLPIFGNRPEMFDGDVSSYFTEDDESSIHDNTHGHSAHYSNLHRSCSNVLVEHNTRGLQIAPIDSETSSPLVTIPSPVSCQAENGVIQGMSSHNEADAEEAWEDNEPPELTFSDATSVGEPSSLNDADSHRLNSVNYSHAYTGDIINCNIIGGIKIQAVLHQARMRIPFAATIPFPRADNAPFSGLEACPLSKEQEVSIVGQLQVGCQKLPFKFSSVVQ